MHIVMINSLLVAPGSDRSSYWEDTKKYASEDVLYLNAFDLLFIALEFLSKVLSDIWYGLENKPVKSCQ